MDDREAYEFYKDPAHREPAGPGRKRKGQRRSVMFSVRFAPEAIEALVDTALAEGLTVSSWIRRLVDREIAQREIAQREIAQREIAQRPSGLIENSGRRGESKSLSSSLQGRTFSCPHFSIGNVRSAECAQCGPLLGHP